MIELIDFPVESVLDCQVRELCFSPDLSSIKLELAPSTGKSDVIVEFSGLVSFKVNSVPNAEFDLEQVLGFECRVLDKLDLDRALQKKKWDYKRSDGSLLVSAPLITARLISTFSLEVLSKRAIVFR